MEFKSEYRWLFFLMIPFIILLSIHIATPLTFVLSTNSLIIKEHTEGNIINMMMTVRTFIIA